MRKKVYVAVIWLAMLVGLFFLVSGLLWGAVFNIVWGVIILGVGLWQILRKGRG